MITTSRRAMTPQEKSQVVGLLKLRPFELIDLVSGCLRFVAIPAAGLGLGALLIIPLNLLFALLPNPPLAMRIGYPLCFLGGLAASIYYLLLDAKRGTRFRDPFEQQVARDLSDGEVELLDAPVSAALSVAGDENNDPALILDLGEGQLLFLQGAYLKAKMMGSKPELPRTHVSWVRLTHTGLVLAVKGTGDVLPINWKRGPLDPETEHQPDDGEILHATLADLVEMDEIEDAATTDA